MKKKLSLVLSLCVILASLTGLSGCGGNSGSGTSSASDTASQSVDSSEASPSEGTSDTASDSSVESSEESVIESSADSSVESVSEPSDEQPSEETADIKQPEDLLTQYETDINKLLKNKEPIGQELLDTTFEYNFLKPEYRSTVEQGLVDLNKELNDIFEKADFENRYGSIPDEIFEYSGYTNVDLSEMTNTSNNSAYYDMPEIEEARRYDVDIYMRITASIGTIKRQKWTSTKWYFVKTGGKWYLVYNDTSLGV